MCDKCTIIKDAITKRLPTILRVTIILNILFFIYIVIYTFYAIVRFRDDLWKKYPSLALFFMLSQNVLSTPFSVILFFIIKRSQR